jgi:IPT/TIG domain
MALSARDIRFRGCHLLRAVAACGLLLLASCGGGSSSSSSSGSPPPSSTPDFSLSVVPASITVAPGGAVALQVSISALNGFSGNVSVAITGAPSGTTFLPGLPLNVAPGQQSISVFVPATAPLGNVSLSVQGSSGSLQHAVSVSMMIQAQSFAGFSLSLNDSELSFAQGSSASTIVGLSITTTTGSANFAVQFSVTGLPNGVTAKFATNPLIPNQPATPLTFNASASAALANYAGVTVVGTRTADGLQESAQLTLNVTPPVGTLPAVGTEMIRLDGTPAAAVYDPVHQLVYASNPEWNRVDLISPSAQQVIGSVFAPSPAGLDLSPDGEHLLVGSNVQQIVTIDTTLRQVVSRANVQPVVQGGVSYSIPALLASTTNGTVLVGMTLNSYPPAYFLEQWNPNAGTFVARSAPGVSAYVSHIVRSADASEVLVVDYGTGVNMAVYDAATDSFPISGQSTVGQITYAVANPAQSDFAILGTSGLAVVDSQLNVLATTSEGFSPDGNVIYGIVFSADGSNLYVVNLYAEALPLIEVYDANTLAFLGEAPAFQTTTPFFATVPPNELAVPTCADASGRIFSLFNHGLVFEDSTNLQNLLALPVVPSIGQIGSANEAPLNVPFATSLGQQSFDVTPDVWFDGQRGTNIQQNGGLISVTAPPSSSAGVADVKAVLPDGWFSIAPKAFSYGTEVYYVGGTASGPEGGAALDLIGHGFLPSPSVTIGGQPGKVISAAAYSTQTPFPFVGIDHVRVEVPNGTSGSGGVTITSVNGSARLSNAFQYLPGDTDYASSDKFTFALYDTTRHNVYLTAGDHVDVFSADSKTFLSSIVPPSISGTRQLRGLALTPDNSELVVANFSDSSIAIINPDNPSSSSAVKIPVTIANSPGVNAVATTSTGMVFVDGVSGTFSGCGAQLWEVDLATSSVTLRTDAALTCLQEGGVQFSTTTTGDEVLIASPNGGAYLWNSSSDQFIRAGGLVSDNGAASGDGVWYASDYSSLDLQLIQHNLAQVPDFFASAFAIAPNGAITGEKMNASGSLLYAPLLDGVDILDTNHGSWIGRILLSEQLPFVQNSMAFDEAGNRLFLICSTGLKLIQLGPPPLSIGYLSPATGSASGGTSLTIRGSGFQSGIAVSIGGNSAAATLVDSSTLQVVTPPGTSGAAQVVVTNPTGAPYALDAAFVYQ